MTPACLTGWLGRSWNLTGPPPTLLHPCMPCWTEQPHDIPEVSTHLNLGHFALLSVITQCMLATRIVIRAYAPGAVLNIRTLMVDMGIPLSAIKCLYFMISIC